MLDFFLNQLALDAGLWSTLQSQHRTEQDSQSKNITEEKSLEKKQKLDRQAKILPSSTPCMVPDVCYRLTDTIEETPTMLSEEESGQTPLNSTTAALTSPIILSLSNEDDPCSLVSPEGALVTIDCEDPNGDTVMLEELPLSIPFQQIQLLPMDASSVLNPQSPLLQASHPRLIPVVEVPAYTDSVEHLGAPHSEHISPRRDVLLSAMTTISHEGLSDLGVTLSPLGILLSPGGDHSEESNVAVVVEGAEETVVVTSGVSPGSCTDMTTIAASVEVSTDHKKKRSSPSNGRSRKSPGSRAAHIVPATSPVELSEAKPSISSCGKRRVLQDHSNFEDTRSPVGENGKARRRKQRNRSPEQFFKDGDENSVFAANQNRTPPGRVSGVILKGRRKAPSSRGGVNKKRIRRV